MTDHLEFEVSCESCGADAVAFLELHAVDMCLMGEPTVGNFRCKECLDQNMARLEEIVKSGEEWCSNCGLTLTTLSCIVIRLTPV